MRNLEMSEAVGRARFENERRSPYKKVSVSAFRSEKRLSDPTIPEGYGDRRPGWYRVSRRSVRPVGLTHPRWSKQASRAGQKQGLELDPVQQ